MTVWQLILHLFNFVLPALAMALLMPWAGRWVMGVGGRRRQHMLWHFLAGVSVLTLGLVFLAGTWLTLTFNQWVLRKGGTDTQWLWFASEPPGLKRPEKSQTH